ncbi:MAG TPA: prenyltransferase/squalene oxidase repeat-containing protein [Bryobacteraceae bacterium]|nr:prenyltransferase/squalene oxidase repeat-containing protein [Bryobacteraceae bacterium]
MTDWKNIQNGDGGWAYNKGCSWTEPTAFVLLAQSATEVDGRSFAAGLKFLRSMQRWDGGWSPQPGVAESTWVTALALLLPEDAIGSVRVTRALQWLENQTGRESSWTERLQRRLAGNKDPSPEGWPWFPGAAAWVIPTSLGILAFERALARRRNSVLRARVEEGRNFLFYRMCADGGWNHGANRALGRDGDSYPETTGIALAALHRAPKSPQIERAKDAARRHLATCRTAEGIAWLRIGLQAHGERVRLEYEPQPRTTQDAALLAIASAPSNPLLS